MIAYVLASKAVPESYVEVPGVPTLAPLVGGHELVYADNIAPPGIYCYIAGKAKYSVGNPSHVSAVAIPPLYPDEAGTPCKVR